MIIAEAVMIMGKFWRAGILCLNPLQYLEKSYC